MSKKKESGNKDTVKHLPRSAQKRMIKVTCPTCRGSGKRGIRICPLCNGDKVIEVVNE